MITAAASSSAAPATSVWSMSSRGRSPSPANHACVASQISVPAVKMSSAAPKATSAGASRGRAIAAIMGLHAMRAYPRMPGISVGESVKIASPLFDAAVSPTL